MAATRAEPGEHVCLPTVLAAPIARRTGTVRMLGRFPDVRARCSGESQLPGEIKQIRGRPDDTRSRCERSARDRAVDCSLGRRVRRRVADRRRGGGILSRAPEDQHQRSAERPGDGTNRRPEPGHRGRQHRDERQCGQARVRTSRVRSRVPDGQQFQRDRQHAVAKRNARRRATVGDALSAVTVRTRLSAKASSLCRTRTVLMLRRKWTSTAGTNGGGGSGGAHAHA